MKSSSGRHTAHSQRHKLVVIRFFKWQLAAMFAVAVAACASRAPATSSVPAYALPSAEPGVPPKWSVPSNGGGALAIADRAVIVQIQRAVGREEFDGVAVYDVASGGELWHRDGFLPVHGSPLFLSDSQSLERVDIRTGRVLWQSPTVCSQTNQQAAYVKTIDGSVYVGCAGGQLHRLSLADGRVLASQNAISVDDYRQIEPLPHDRLAVAGYASIGMVMQTAILQAQTLRPIEPIQMFTPDRLILGIRNGEAIVADVCCRGTPDTNSPGAVLGVSLTNGDILWSVAIHPYQPRLPLSDVEPGAGIFVLADDRLYVGTRTALFVYRVSELRALGSKAPRRELYSDLRDRPQVYGGRYLGISEGKAATVRRSAIFDTIAAREIWNDDSGSWSAPPPQTQTSPVAELYKVTQHERRFALMRLSDGKMLPIDTGCFLQTANERYAVALCGRRGRLPELALFDLDSSANIAALPSKKSTAQASQPSGAPSAAVDPVLARWTEHQWNSIGSTGQTYFFGREPNGIVAVSRRSGDVQWQNTSVCGGARTATVIDEILYVACPETIAILDRASGQVVHKQNVGIYGFNAITAAGDTAIVVEGWNDGAALRKDMAILDKNTLKPITDRQISDSTFLGIIGDRAYIDDWCCFGRPDQYRPATIYSVSLKDGSVSKPVDLSPEPELHPARMQPLGQGARNYLEGYYFYVVTPNYTYRYDVRNLRLPPVRTVTPSNSPVNPVPPTVSPNSAAPQHA